MHEAPVILGSTQADHASALTGLQCSLYYLAMTLMSSTEPLHRLGRALADPNRCAILICLLEGPHYPTELAQHLGLTKANMSNHLACLRGCGLVTITREGRRHRYELADPRLAHALEDLRSLGPQLEAACEAETTRSR